MSTSQRSRKQKKKYYTVDQANATLPLLRQILRDVTELAHSLNERNELIKRMQQDAGQLTPAHNEEIQTMLADFERDQEKMHEFEDELRRLNVELKDYFTGLVDFRCMMDDREVYLCWRLGEPQVAHWHELDSGFSGRRKLEPADPETTIQ
jgi:hypothetical protein